MEKQNYGLIVFISNHLSKSEEVDILRGAKIHRHDIEQRAMSWAAI